FEDLDAKEIRDGLQAACRIWSEQLAETHLVNDIAAGRVPRTVLLGWLLETYHYVKAFPHALEVAAAAATGPLREVLARYAGEEHGHEAFVAESLVRAGFTRQEVETSIPLVSTRTIDLLMREMFRLFPASALLVAAVLEVEGSEPEGLAAFRRGVRDRYGVPEEALVPFHEHVAVDDRLGHARLLHEHVDLVTFPDGDALHRVVNGLHDLKHAFDLQKLEIVDYYSRTGNYVPRQFVSFFAI
ncbi:MAG TPA: iron-containing redox enzyme family protein, partial [Methylomirabilota bacterium]|nr:iron-containing redox enzyme family protein [Methylomirabilota bacterium]